MGRTIFRIAFVVFAWIGASFAVSVSVSSPANYANVGTSLTLNASASSSQPITGWHIYVDSRNAYSGGRTSAISAPLTLSPGTHQVIVRAWDATGAYGSAYLQLTAGTTNSNVTVNVSSPTDTSMTSPVNFTASASSGYPISGWRIYVDSTSVYAGGATSTISAPVPMAPGPHQVVIRAWNTTGAHGSAGFTLNVGDSNNPSPTPTGPVPPPNATAYTNLEDRSPWGQCSSGSCSGGIASTSTYWMARNQTTPSLDGSSAEFFMAGPPYSTDLFWLKFGNNTSASRYIFDFNVYVDEASLRAVEALEFDLYHVANHMKYMFATECNYWTKTWDVWNEVTQRWIPSNASCSKFTPGTWHRVQWAVERVGAQTHYLSVTVDGVTQNISDAYAWQPAVPTGWDNGNLGFQVQQDLSLYPGSGFHQWLDKITVYAW